MVYRTGANVEIAGEMPPPAANGEPVYEVQLLLSFGLSVGCSIEKFPLEEVQKHMKRHQRQDEIVIFIPCTILESAKLFFCQYARFLYKRMLCEMCAFIVSPQGNWIA